MGHRHPAVGGPETFQPRSSSKTADGNAVRRYWGFAFDDARCDNGALSKNPAEFVALSCALQRVLDAPHESVAQDRFVRALHDIGAGFRAHATPTQVRRFADAHRNWLHCVAWQISNASVERIPDVDTYLSMRLGSCGGPPTLAMLEIANGTEVPDSEMDSPAVRALTEMTRLIAALDNDLHSYRKEFHQNDADQNIVSALMHENDWDVRRAVTGAVAIRDRVMTRFLHLRDRRHASASEPLARYLAGLGHAIRGNIDWALRVPRYTSLSDTSAPPAPAAEWSPGWSERPSDPSTAPLPVPGIAWWWDRDL